MKGKKQNKTNKTIKKLAIREEKSGPEVNRAIPSEARFGGRTKI